VSGETRQVIRDAKGPEVGTIRYDYTPCKPWHWFELSIGFLGIGLGIWLVGGTVLKILFEILSEIVGHAGVGIFVSYGFNIAGLAGLGLAVWWVVTVLRDY